MEILMETESNFMILAFFISLWLVAFCASLFVLLGILVTILLLLVTFRPQVFRARRRPDW